MKTTEQKLLERCAMLIGELRENTELIVLNNWQKPAPYQADIDEADAVLGELKAYLAKPAQPTNQYEQAIDDELMNSFLGTKDDFKYAKSALLAIIDWTRKVALDPTVSPEAAKLLEQAKPVQEPAPDIRYKVTILTDEYPNGIPLESWAKIYCTSPQSREPMTYSEIADIASEHLRVESDDAFGCVEGEIEFARAIEAHHGIGAKA